MSGERISEMTELLDINAGDYIEVSEDDGAGGYNTKKYDLEDVKASMSKTDWMFDTHDNGSQSGAVTLTPSNGYRQESAITGNITGLTCALSATYPSIIWEVTTNGDYTLDLTGYETDNGDAITLPVSGKCIIALFLSADGTTKYAQLVATEVA